MRFKIFYGPWKNKEIKNVSHIWFNKKVPSDKI